MKNKGFAALILIVILLAGLIMLYYFKTGGAHKERPVSEKMPPTPEEVAEATRKMNEYLDATRFSFLKYLEEDFDTVIVINSFERLKTAMNQGRVNTNILTNVPILMRETMLDSVINVQEAESILELMDRSVMKKGQ